MVESSFVLHRYHHLDISSICFCSLWKEGRQQELNVRRKHGETGRAALVSSTALPVFFIIRAVDPLPRISQNTANFFLLDRLHL